MTNRLSFAETHAAVQFSEQLARTDLWLRAAESLLAAAKELEPSIDASWEHMAKEAPEFEALYGAELQPPHFLLVAFAIENLLKALLVHRRLSEIEGKLLSSLPKFLRTHNLLELAQSVSFPLSISDEDLLFRLSRNSIWAGRYPTPAGPKDQQSVARLSDGNHYLAAYFAPSDVGNLRDLCSRVETFVQEELGVAV